MGTSQEKSTAGEKWRAEKEIGEQGKGSQIRRRVNIPTFNSSKLHKHGSTSASTETIFIRKLLHKSNHLDDTASAETPNDSSGKGDVQKSQTPQRFFGKGAAKKNEG